MFELILKNISKHILLAEDEIKFFTSLLKHKRLRKKQFLLEEGEICHHECFVNNGCLRMYSLDDKGQEHIIQFAAPDWWIGDQYSFLTGLPSAYFIDALEESEVLLIEKKQLEDLYAGVPKFERYFRIAFQNSPRLQNRRVLC